MYSKHGSDHKGGELPVLPSHFLRSSELQPQNHMTGQLKLHDKLFILTRGTRNGPLQKGEGRESLEKKAIQRGSESPNPVCELG